MYPDPLEAATPADVLGYWLVWKEMKTNKTTRARIHTVTHVDKNGPEMNTGVVHSVKIYWRKKGIHYDHKAQTQSKTSNGARETIQNRRNKTVSNIQVQPEILGPKLTEVPIGPFFFDLKAMQNTCAHY